MTVIDERRSDGIACGHFQPTHLLGDFIHNLLPNLGAALDLNDVGGPFRLEKQIDLHPLPFLSPISVGRCGINERVLKMKERKQFLKMVHDKVLEL